MQIKRGFDTLEWVNEIVQGNAYIVGGFARWALSPREEPAPYGDIDIVCYDFDSFDNLMERLKLIDTDYIEYDHSYKFAIQVYS